MGIDPAWMPDLCASMTIPKGEKSGTRKGVNSLFLFNETRSVFVLYGFLKEENNTIWAKTSSFRRSKFYLLGQYRTRPQCKHTIFLERCAVRLTSNKFNFNTQDLSPDSSKHSRIPPNGLAALPYCTLHKCVGKRLHEDISGFLRNGNIPEGVL